MIDVIKFKNNDERIINLCCFLFRNALITDNIDIAQKIAFYGKRIYRVVTMDGILIAESGLTQKRQNPLRGLLGG